MSLNFRGFAQALLFFARQEQPPARQQPPPSSEMRPLTAALQNCPLSTLTSRQLPLPAKARLKDQLNKGLIRRAVPDELARGAHKKK